MPILDDDVVRMGPSDLIGRDNRGTKGVRLGQLVLRELVSDYYDLISSKLNGTEDLGIYLVTTRTKS